MFPLEEQKFSFPSGKAGTSLSLREIHNFLFPAGRQTPTPPPGKAAEPFGLPNEGEIPSSLQEKPEIPFFPQKNRKFPFPSGKPELPVSLGALGKEPLPQVGDRPQIPSPAHPKPRNSRGKIPEFPNPPARRRALVTSHPEPVTSPRGERQAHPPLPGSDAPLDNAGGCAAL